MEDNRDIVHDEHWYTDPRVWALGAATVGTCVALVLGGATFSADWLSPVQQQLGYGTAALIEAVALVGGIGVYSTYKGPEE